MPTRPVTRFTDAELQREFEHVQRQLSEALDELHPLLGELVRGQLADSFSPQRVGLVLAAAVGYPDTPTLAQRRVLLAAALEMLRLALTIHKLLLRGEQSGEPTGDRSWLGSIILAGDYCFSRSAVLAAQTDEPRVVAIFADALKRVSEGHLRQLFEAKGGPFAEDDEIMDAGLLAALVLTGQTDDPANTIVLGRELLRRGRLDYALLPPHQRRRWRAVQEGVGSTTK